MSGIHKLARAQLCIALYPRPGVNKPLGLIATRDFKGGVINPGGFDIYIYIYLFLSLYIYIDIISFFFKKTYIGLNGMLKQINAFTRKENPTPAHKNQR